MQRFGSAVIADQTTEFFNQVSKILLNDSEARKYPGIVTFAYSLVSDLFCGNANIVRIPSKDFPQVRMINHAINNALKEYVHLSPYIVLAKYGHDKVINDLFSSIADVRIVWRGEQSDD